MQIKKWLKFLKFSDRENLKFSRIKELQIWRANTLPYFLFVWRFREHFTLYFSYYSVLGMHKILWLIEITTFFWFIFSKKKINNFIVSLRRTNAFNFHLVFGNIPKIQCFVRFGLKQFSKTIYISYIGGKCYDRIRFWWSKTNSRLYSKCLQERIELLQSTRRWIQQLEKTTQSDSGGKYHTNEANQSSLFIF